MYQRDCTMTPVPSLSFDCFTISAPRAVVRFIRISSGQSCSLVWADHLPNRHSLHSLRILMRLQAAPKVMLSELRDVLTRGDVLHGHRSELHRPAYDISPYRKHSHCLARVSGSLERSPRSLSSSGPVPAVVFASGDGRMTFSAVTLGPRIVDSLPETSHRQLRSQPKASDQPPRSSHLIHTGPPSAPPSPLAPAPAAAATAPPLLLASHGFLRRCA